MYYHAKITYAQTSHYWHNLSKENMIDKLVRPIVNGQVIKIFLSASGYAILNTKTVSTLFIYCTEDKLIKSKDSSIPSQINEKSFNQFNCTSEFLEEYNNYHISNARSDLERKFSETTNQVFVIMKFGDKELDSAYEGVIEPIIKEHNLTPIRVDRLHDSGKITDQIIEFIATSKYVIADLTGERPNTYYEAGYAHALGKEIILTIKKNEKIHFDLSGHRFIQWETEADLRKQLRDRFKNLENE